MKVYNLQQSPGDFQQMKYQIKSKKPENIFQKKKNPLEGAQGENLLAIFMNTNNLSARRRI
jgi:hypothetical protein